MPLFFGITNLAVEKYLYDSLPERAAVFRQMEEHAAREDVPIIGPLEGEFLYVLALSGGVRDALDVGTATGYSGLWMGLAAEHRGGRVLGLERDPGRAERADGYWRQAGLSSASMVRIGDAFATLRDLPDTFDMIFNDIVTQIAGPSEAVELADLCIARLRPGGLLVADNALRKGGVADPQNHALGVETMRAYLQRVNQHPDLHTVIVPLRDGVALSVRTPEG